MAVFNGPAIKTESMDEILKSVSKRQDLAGPARRDGLLKLLTARLLAERINEVEPAGVEFCEGKG